MLFLKENSFSLGCLIALWFLVLLCGADPKPALFCSILIIASAIARNYFLKFYLKRKH